MHVSTRATRTERVVSLLPDKSNRLAEHTGQASSQPPRVLRGGKRTRRHGGASERGIAQAESPPRRRRQRRQPRMGGVSDHMSSVK